MTTENQIKNPITSKYNYDTNLLFTTSELNTKISRKGPNPADIKAILSQNELALDEKRKNDLYNENMNKFKVYVKQYNEEQQRIERETMTPEKQRKILIKEQQDYNKKINTINMSKINKNKSLEKQRKLSSEKTGQNDNINMNQEYNNIDNNIIMVNNNQNQENTNIQKNFKLNLNLNNAVISNDPNNMNSNSSRNKPNNLNAKVFKPGTENSSNNNSNVNNNNLIRTTRSKISDVSINNNNNVLENKSESVNINSLNIPNNINNINNINSINVNDDQEQISNEPQCKVIDLCSEINNQINEQISFKNKKKDIMYKRNFYYNNMSNIYGDLNSNNTTSLKRKKSIKLKRMNKDISNNLNKIQQFRKNGIKDLNGADESNDEIEDKNYNKNLINNDKDNGLIKKSKGYKNLVSIKKPKFKNDFDKYRYIKGLKAIMTERLGEKNIIIPNICSCGNLQKKLNAIIEDGNVSVKTFCNIDCANNCIYYHKPEEYEYCIREIIKCIKNIKYESFNNKY